MKRTAFLLTVMTALVTFAGCSKDKEEDPTVSKLEVVLNVETISKDILDYFDVVYSYINFEGDTVSTPITGTAEIKFHIDNPELGYDESTPFAVELAITPKSTAPKQSGSYDSSFEWQLDVNAYDQKGSLITDSGKISRFFEDAQFANDNFSAFSTNVCSGNLKAIKYMTFFCKTNSGVWHIGVSGLAIQSIRCPMF